MQTFSRFVPRPPRALRRAACRRPLAAGALTLLLLGLSACANDRPGPVVTVHSASGDAVVSVELALTREAQARGLMYRTELDEDAGMLFVFDGEAERTFWMSNTPIPLDILYIRSDATVVSIAANTTPYSKKTIPSRGPARYVLEVRGGWAARHGVKPGDRLTLPDIETNRSPGG